MVDVRTIPFSLHRTARWFPDEEAFVQGFGGEARRYTFGEAREAVVRVANALRDLGVVRGDRVALLGDSTVEHALVHYGCTLLGAVPAGLHTREAPATLRKMVDRIRASALVFGPRYAGKLDRFRTDLEHADSLLALDGVDRDVDLGETPPWAESVRDLVADADGGDPAVEVGREDTAYINFSSGTTGVPKPLVTTHEGIAEMIHLEAGGLTEEKRVLNAFGTGFMGWENVTLTNVAVGATTVFHDGDVRRVAELAERERLTRISLVTSPWRILLREGEVDAYDLSSVESAGVSGEPITPDLYAEIRDRVTESVGTGYGLTETMGSGTSLPARLIDEETIHSVGKPARGCEVRVVDPEAGNPDAELPEGEVGEVIVAGPSLCEGVFEDPERTAEIFRDGWVFTGDRGRIEDGFLYLQGRADNMIISGGINVYAERVERVLEAHPNVSEAAVVGTPHERWGEAVKAYVVAAGGLAAEDLETWCREREDLADYQRPREYEFVDALPRNNPGKLDRAALRAREREDEDEDVDENEEDGTGTEE